MHCNAEGSSRFKRWKETLLRPSAKYSVLSVLLIGIVVGILLWGGFNTGLEATNTLEFCTSCHEMRDNVYEEYRDTIHWANRTGVRVVCSDCHVPKDWTHKMARKIKASTEVWAKLTGRIDTKEKFEARRMELAQHEWDRLAANGSAECRNCHSFDNMVARKQNPRAQKKHAWAKQEGKTCIHCHKGIAHLLPADYRDPDDE